MKEKIAAVVVTYNRLDLLKKCIDALRAQTRKLDSIIAINNGSTDSTKDWLEAQDDITVFNQENSGGAGGFHRGMKEAYDAGFEWVWVMDDDGIPAEDCLEILYKISQERKVLYVAPSLFDFEGNPHYGDRINASLDKECFYNMGAPFNAILMHRKIFEKVGFANKKFFIWGDEYEFIDRVVDSGIVMLTSIDARHFHRKTGFKLHACPRSYYFIRNKIWRYKNAKGVFVNKLLLRYEAFDWAFRLFIKGLLHFNIKQAREVIKGIYHGLTKDGKYE